MSEPFLGEIRMFGFNFAPRGWAFCNGQILSIAQNTALFALLGTTYGGNGQTTFALPNLQSRVPIHFGQGPGLSPYSLGQLSGQENVTLLPTQMPAHSHSLACHTDDAATGIPNGNFPAASAQNIYASAATPGQFMNAGMVTVAGNSQPHTNIQPYLAINFCIALQGIFPSRN
jgi:microcystin-dependent protein